MDSTTTYFLPTSSDVLWVAIIIGFLINIVLGLAVGEAAKKKGRNFGSFFGLSLVLGWALPALVVAALAPLNSDSRGEKVASFADKERFEQSNETQVPKFFG
ncbi:MAG: hypothetical protein RL196_283 [Actinomycetota bacterium]|jgi:ABC-type dipeptide/oligopeptide/nickel transport system permease component